jgi:CheY-like chemotaxis protein
MKGYEAVEAKNCLEALEIARLSPCDLIITDHVIAGMMVLDLIERLRTERYHARYLLISGCGIDDDGAADLPFLSKPFTMRQLMEAVEKLVSEPHHIHLKLIKGSGSDWRPDRQRNGRR